MTEHMKADTVETAKLICEQSKHRQIGTLASKLAKNKFAAGLQHFQETEADMNKAKKCMRQCFQSLFLKELNKNGRTIRDDVSNRLDEIRDEMIKHEGRVEGAAAAARGGSGMQT